MPLKEAKMALYKDKFKCFCESLGGNYRDSRNIPWSTLHHNPPKEATQILVCDARKPTGEGYRTEAYLRKQRPIGVSVMKFFAGMRRPKEIVGEMVGADIDLDYEITLKDVPCAGLMHGREQNGCKETFTMISDFLRRRILTSGSHICKDKRSIFGNEQLDDLLEEFGELSKLI